MGANTLDSRRFFRLDLPLRCIVTARNRLPGCDLYATPAQYVTPQRTRQAEVYLEDCRKWLSQIQENTGLVTEIYKDVMHRVNFFNEIMTSVEQGRMPLKLDDYARNLEMAKNENIHLETYKESSPKTYAFFKAIENKIKIYLNEFHYMAVRSNSRELAYRHGLFSIVTQADKNLQILMGEKFEHLPLPRFIRSLTQYVDVSLASFLEFQSDYLLRRFPTQWPELKVNLSEGGMRLELAKNLRVGEAVCVAFYSADFPTVIGLKGTIISTEPISDTALYRIRINFDFPDRTQQVLIQKLMNEFEVTQSIAWI